MSAKFRIAGLALLVVSLSAAAWGENSAWPLSTERLGLLKETSIFLGQPVRDTAGKNLGKIEDLLVDLSASQVIVALVASGGQTIPVPATSFSAVYNASAALGVDKATFASAPRLTRSGTAEIPQLKDLAESFRHFKQKEPALAPAPGKLVSAARLLGVPLLSQANEPLGQVKDIMVDMPLGQVIYLVIVPATGSASDCYVVPPVAVRADTPSQALLLNFDRAHFAAGPHFQKEFWTDITFPQLALAVQQHYRLQPAAETVTTVAAAATPGAAAPARPDRELTRAILAEIVHEGSGLTALNLVITTVNGRVILKGSVRNEKQARQVLAIAERVAGPGNVEDQLQYRGRIVVRARSN